MCFFYMHLEVSWYSLEQVHLVVLVDKLSFTAVVFFRFERILKWKCLYGA